MLVDFEREEKYSSHVNQTGTHPTEKLLHLQKKSIDKGHIRWSEIEAVINKVYKGIITKAQINSIVPADIYDYRCIEKKINQRYTLAS